MYCGIQECHGQQGQLVRFSCNTDSISEMTNNNLLFLCPPQAKVSRLKEWEQKQDEFCAGRHAVVGARHSSTHCSVNPFALLLKRNSYHFSRVDL